MPAARDPLSAVNLRVPAHMLRRADALREAVAAAPELAVVPNVTRSDVLRLCMLRGLEVLERQYEDVVDDELAAEAARRLDAGEAGRCVPLEEALGRLGL
jgi:hypothetical protein